MGAVAVIAILSMAAFAPLVVTLRDKGRSVVAWVVVTASFFPSVGALLGFVFPGDGDLSLSIFGGTVAGILATIPFLSFAIGAAREPPLGGSPRFELLDQSSREEATLFHQERSGEEAIGRTSHVTKTAIGRTLVGCLVIIVGSWVVAGLAWLIANLF